MTTATAVETVPQFSLKDAVIRGVNELKSKGNLSIHDVTLAVRAAANGGEIALPGLEAQPNNSGIKYWIDHNDVKQVVEGLEADGTLSSLGLKEVDYTGPYRVYKFDYFTDDAASTDPVTPVAPTIPPDPDPATATVTSNPTDGPVKARIRSYVNNAMGTVTVKQIQSALKIRGYLCEDLVDTLREMGYIVRPGTKEDYFSTYTVS